MELFAIGVTAGVLGALFGVGGGIIVVPLMTFVSGYTVLQSVAISLVVVTGTSVAGSVTYLAQDRVDIQAALQLQSFSVAGAVTASLAAPFVPEAPLLLLLSVILWVTAAYMWPRPVKQRASRPLPYWIGPSGAFGAGTLSGLLGLGGGFINTPLLFAAYRLPFTKAAATSTFVIGLTASAAATVYLVRGDVPFGWAATALAGTMLGALGSSLVAHRLGQRSLLMAFSVFLVAVGFRMLLSAVRAW